MKINTQIHNLFISKITGLTGSQLFLQKPQLTSDQQDTLNEMITRLSTGEPLEYILRQANFYGVDLYIDNRVLVPRDDTEVMVDQVLKLKIPHFNLIDVGTGSGAIPIAINKQCPFVQNTVAIDISQEALDVAAINIKYHKLNNKIQLLHGSLLAPLRDCKLEGMKNLVITANLPYIKDNDYENMDPETVKYEPDSALYGGSETGFELYETLIDQAIVLKSEYNIEKLFLFIEIGFDQREYSQQYLENKSLNFEYFKDNGKIERCIKITL